MEPTQGDSAELVRRAQAGEEAAFREIVERYQAKIFSVVRGILGPSNDAEDIAQTVFLKAYLALPRLELRSSLLTWLYKITVNECFDFLRKKKVRKLVLECDLPEDAPQNRSREPVETGAPLDVTLGQRDLARRLLARLPAPDRMLLLLREVEGYSIAELAEITSTNESTIKVKLFRARKKLLRASRHLAHGVANTVAYVPSEELSTIRASTP